MATSLMIFLALIVVLFVIAIVLIAVGSVRAKHKVNDTIVSDPIPERRNPQTRRDQVPQGDR